MRFLRVGRWHWSCFAVTHKMDVDLAGPPGIGAEDQGHYLPLALVLEQSKCVNSGPFIKGRWLAKSRVIVGPHLGQTIVDLDFRVLHSFFKYRLATRSRRRLKNKVLHWCHLNLRLVMPFR